MLLVYSLFTSSLFTAVFFEKVQALKSNKTICQLIQVCLIENKSKFYFKNQSDLTFKVSKVCIDLVHSKCLRGLFVTEATQYCVHGRLQQIKRSLANPHVYVIKCKDTGIFYNL